MIVYCEVKQNNKFKMTFKYSFYDDVERALKVYNYTYGYDRDKLIILYNGHQFWDEIDYIRTGYRNETKLLYDYDRAKKRLSYISDAEEVGGTDYLVYLSLTQNEVKQEIRRRKLNRILNEKN